MSKYEARFNIVLFQPEIPSNTGNIGRVCVASQCHLHLIGPMGFSIDEKQVRRAGLDYWKHLDYTYYDNYEIFLEKNAPIDRLCFLSTKAEKTVYEHQFQVGDWLMFGPETRGLPEEMFKPKMDWAFQIPMIGPTRSLNLSNAVSIVAFEGLRQLGKNPK